MDRFKVVTIRDWLASTNVTEQCSFLGLANYYRRFIKGYSEMAIPLIDLKKGREWRWELECQTIFQRFKDAITSKLGLRLPDLKLLLPLLFIKASFHCKA